MRTLRLAFAASAAIIIGAAAPAFAQESHGLKAILVTDVGRDVDALSSGTRTEARMVRSAPAEFPPFEALADIGGAAQIEVDLDERGTLTNAAVHVSSGRTRLDRSALDSVRASTYLPATINGRAVGGRYVVEVVFDPQN
jgi:TonB family protein